MWMSAKREEGDQSVPGADAAGVHVFFDLNMKALQVTAGVDTGKTLLSLHVLQVNINNCNMTGYHIHPSESLCIVKASQFIRIHFF